MKKITSIAFALMLISISLLTTSCSTVRPFCATGNTLGSKVGTAQVDYLFGVIPLSKNDVGIKKAMENGKITKVSVIDVKYKWWVIGVTAKTVVYGD